MIRFDRVTVTYPEQAQPALSDVRLDVPEGELCLVVGRTGSGKTTLLRCVNGLVPHFSGGLLAGSVTVDGLDTRTHRPRDLAHVVGVVPQNPLAGFVTDTVEDELAYGMESLGVAPPVMRRRVEETLDLLGLTELRARPLLSLSAGQQQRVAIGAVLTPHPRVLVLDEPTSALDPPAAEEVLAALTRLVHDLGLTVLLAEHRLERVVEYADRVVRVDAGRVSVGPPAEVVAELDAAPAVVELGRVAGWHPVPLSVRDARRRATSLRARLAGHAPARRSPPPSTSVARLERVGVAYGATTALADLDLAVGRGEVVALMGRNGAGKSTLLRCLVGLAVPERGRVRLDGDDPARLAPRDLVRRAGLVPQQPADLLWEETVGAECATADRDAGLPPGTTRAALEALAPGVDDSRHPRDLSEGQRLAVVLAVVLAPEPALLLLDEPTRGLDYASKQELARLLRGRAGQGTAVVLATHDVELAAVVADRVVVLAGGEVVADGPAADVVASSPAFAPQVAKVLAPEPWLTVAEVAAALDAAAAP